ncbi:MAG: SDR family oxidoreductase [Candidatus Omnitrophica bacterium]|nr:SDR family oxidoreductase [Candidatus Omnitrophota bacterium]
MKKPSVLIAGCGYYGLFLARRLSSEGSRVWGLRRDPQARDLIRQAGAEPVIADLTDPVTLRGLPPADWVVSCQGAGRGADYRKTYLEGAKNLLAALHRRPPHKWIWISSIRVYSQDRGEWIDEQTPPDPKTEEARALWEAESVVLSAPFFSLVIRPAGIYGPGRDRTKILRDGAAWAAGGYLNNIHIEDLVELTLFLAEKGKDKEIYLAADGHPVFRKEFYSWLAGEAGIPAPPGRPEQGESAGKRCSNRKVTGLGFSFRYPDPKAGFAAVLKGRSRGS